MAVPLAVAYATVTVAALGAESETLNAALLVPASPSYKATLFTESRGCKPTLDAMRTDPNSVASPPSQCCS